MKYAPKLVYKRFKALKILSRLHKIIDFVMMALYSLNLTKYTSIVNRLLSMVITPRTASESRFSLIFNYWPILIYVLIRVLQWFFNTPKRKEKEIYPIAPPIQNKKPEYQGKCPLCASIFIEPCALDRSGYVFCKECIRQYISKYKRCPVTGSRCDESSIRRLYI